MTMEKSEISNLKSQIPKHRVIDFADVPGVPCPCGTAHRALHDEPAVPFSLHRTEISADACKHYHRRLTETYYILECGPDAFMELADDRVPLRPGVAVVIPPEVRHRAVGPMTVLIVVTPKFDPSDEWFD